MPPPPPPPSSHATLLRELLVEVNLSPSHVRRFATRSWTLKRRSRRTWFSCSRAGRHRARPREEGGLRAERVGQPRGHGRSAWVLRSFQGRSSVMCRRRLAPGPFLDPSDKLRIALLRGNPGTARPTGPGGVGLPQQQEAAQRQRRGSAEAAAAAAAAEAAAEASRFVGSYCVDFHGFETFGARQAVLPVGGVSTYYEVELLGPLPKYPQLGWAAEGWFETTTVAPPMKGLATCRAAGVWMGSASSSLGRGVRPVGGQAGESVRRRATS